MALLTVAELRQHIETDLPDSALQRLLDDADQEVVQRFGPHTQQIDVRTTADPSAFPAGRDRFIFTSRPVASVNSIKETFPDGTEVTLTAQDYRVLDGGRRLERLDTGPNPRQLWGPVVTVDYVPVDDTARRRRVIIDLCKLAIQYRALASENAGDYSASYPDYQAAREALLRTLRPRGGLGAMA